jgi:hypothetical protein
MRNYSTMAMKVLCAVILCGILVAGPVRSQTFEQRLARVIHFVPDAISPFDQLIEVARAFGIPMGIEVNIESCSKIYTRRLLQGPNTLGSLISQISKEIPEYKMEFNDGVINIIPVQLADNPKSYLNLRIPEFRLDQEDVWGAEANLRRAIKSTLHPVHVPPRAPAGSVSGYIVPIDRGDGFDRQNIKFSGRNLTVREILNSIALQNGNAYWVVYENPTKMMVKEQFYAQEENSSDQTSGEDFTWRFAALHTTVAKQ